MLVAENSGPHSFAATGTDSAWLIPSRIQDYIRSFIYYCAGETTKCIKQLANGPGTRELHLDQIISTHWTSR